MFSLFFYHIVQAYKAQKYVNYCIFAVELLPPFSKASSNVPLATTGISSEAVLRLCRPGLGYLFFLYHGTFLGPLCSLWLCLDTEHSQGWSAGRCSFWKPQQLLKDGEVNRWQCKTLWTAFDSSCFQVIWKYMVINIWLMVLYLN